MDTSVPTASLGGPQLARLNRLSTMALADDILILEQGEVVEYGPRLVLAADPTSHYAAMLRLAAEEVIA